ncbi:hypothetical protein EDC01DRAFT_645773 [Geopyxis carbonaria]|nr:hypothetical protein EDC01DRAFT_645773 [Geopyxis carbonaria]
MSVFSLPLASPLECESDSALSEMSVSSLPLVTPIGSEKSVSTLSETSVFSLPLVSPVRSEASDSTLSEVSLSEVSLPLVSDIELESTSSPALSEMSLSSLPMVSPSVSEASESALSEVPETSPPPPLPEFGSTSPPSPMTDAETPADVFDDPPTYSIHYPDSDGIATDCSSPIPYPGSDSSSATARAYSSPVHSPDSNPDLANPTTTSSPPSQSQIRLPDTPPNRRIPCPDPIIHHLPQPVPVPLAKHKQFVLLARSNDIRSWDCDEGLFSPPEEESEMESVPSFSKGVDVEEAARMRRRVERVVAMDARKMGVWENVFLFPEGVDVEELARRRRGEREDRMRVSLRKDLLEQFRKKSNRETVREHLRMREMELKVLEEESG